MQNRLLPADSSVRRAYDTATRYFEAGRAAWPEIVLEYEKFANYFTRHASESAPAESRAADLYLACACAHGVPAALAAFERKHTASMARVVASVDPSPAFVQEALQTVRERLLVPRGAEPGRMAEYAGRASLESWLRAVAVRSAISQRRPKRNRVHAPLAADADERLARGGPE